MHCNSTFLLNNSWNGLFSSNLVFKPLEISFSQTALWCISRQLFRVSLPWKKKTQKTEERKGGKIWSCFADIIEALFSVLLLLNLYFFVNNYIWTKYRRKYFSPWQLIKAYYSSAQYFSILIEWIFLTCDDKEHLLSSQMSGCSH